MLRTKLIASTLSVSLLSLFSSHAFAGCYLVACQNANIQTSGNNYQSGENLNIDNNQIESAYNDGYRAGISKARVITKTVYIKSHKTSVATKKRVIANRIVKKPVASRNYVSNQRRTRVYTSNTNTSANNNSRIYTSYNPIKDRAYNYNSSSYGSSISLINYYPNGDKWVSTSGQIIRYSTPISITNNGGRLCGYGVRIDNYGNPTGERAYVCKCAGGWQKVQ